MAGLPSVMKVKLQALEAAQPPQSPVQSRPAPSAVASMSPGPRGPVAVPDAPLDEDAFVAGAQGAQPGVGPSAAAPAAPEPVEPPAPKQLTEDEQRIEDEKRWKEATPDLYHRYKTLAGVYERAKSDMAQLKNELAELRGELKALKEAPKPAPVAELPPVPVSDLTPEQIETYKDAFPVIESLSAKQTKALMDQVIGPMQQEINALKEKTESVGVEIKDAGEAAFVNNVRSRVKDMDNVVRSSEWANYVSQRVPYTSSTVGELLVAAHQARDLDRVEEIFNGFKRPVKNDINELITPTASTGAAPNTQPGSDKKMLAISLRRKASDDFRKGRITREQRDKIDAMYQKAEAEGRIDYNA